MHSDVHCSIIHNSQGMKNPLCPSVEEWIKMWHIYQMWYIVLHIHDIHIYMYVCVHIDISS